MRFMNHMEVVVVIMRRLVSLVPFLQQRQGIPCLQGIDARKLRDLGQNLERTIESMSPPGLRHKDLTAVLVRSDGFVAWASESEPNLTAGCEIKRTLVRNVASGRNTNFIYDFYRSESDDN